MLRNCLYLSLIILVVALLSWNIKKNYFSTIVAGTKNEQIAKPETRTLPSPTATATAFIAPTPKPLATIPVHSGKQVRVPILTYHYVGNNPNPEDKARDNLQVIPDKFEEQMKYLATNGYSTITFDDLYVAIKSGGILPQKALILTFDDGYIDFYLNAYPILKKYNLKATEFIPTGLMDASYYMHWDQISEMNNSGLISFEAHSVSHPNMTALTYEEMVFQAKESKRILGEKTGKEVNFFAYPYGMSNELAWKAVKEAGYKGAVGTWFGNIESEGVLFNMPRIKIAGGLSIEEFAMKVQ